MPTVAIKNPVPDRVLASECPDVENYKCQLNPVWHKMHYTCTHMVKVGARVKKDIFTCDSAAIECALKRFHHSI